MLISVVRAFLRAALCSLCPWTATKVGPLANRFRIPNAFRLISEQKAHHFLRILRIIPLQQCTPLAVACRVRWGVKRVPADVLIGTAPTFRNIVAAVLLADSGQIQTAQVALDLLEVLVCSGNRISSHSRRRVIVVLLPSWPTWAVLGRYSPVGDMD